jgi:hypothetical protein
MSDAPIDAPPSAPAPALPGAPEDSAAADFAARAAEPPRGLAAELWGYLAANKKWWLTPILLTLLLFAALLVISATGGGPFIYTLF